MGDPFGHEDCQELAEELGLSAFVIMFRQISRRGKRFEPPERRCDYPEYVDVRLIARRSPLFP